MQTGTSAWDNDHDNEGGGVEGVIKIDQCSGLTLRVIEKYRASLSLKIVRDTITEPALQKVCYLIF